MKRYDLNFSYYFFEGKIISMLKDIVYSEDPTKLVWYDSNVKSDFSNILDLSFSGNLKIKNMYLKNNNVCIDMEIFTYNTLYQNGKIIRKSQIFNATVARKREVYSTSVLRTQAINCKSCGAVIDIIHNKKCNYCDSTYDLKDYDFVFTDLYIR